MAISENNSSSAELNAKSLETQIISQKYEQNRNWFKSVHLVIQTYPSISDFHKTNNFLVVID
jgi:predicted methyltransferase